jgi:hypothetical protein
LKPVDDRHEQYCPNCSGVSQTGGYCAACLAVLTAAERGDNSSWLQEDSFTAFGGDGDEAFGGDGDEAFGGDGGGVDDRHEQYCPNCSGVSQTGGYCAACLAVLTAAERGDNSSWLQEDSFTAFGGDGGDGNAFAANLVDHHIFPREFKDLFKKPDVDIDIHEHTVTMHAFQHWAVHSDGWNADWNMFFEMYREAGIDPRREEVMAYGEFLMDKFGFADAPLHDYNDKGGDLGSHII